VQAYTKVVVRERFLNAQTSKQRGKNWQFSWASLAAGGPSSGTTGAMVNPALIVRLFVELFYELRYWTLKCGTLVCQRYTSVA